MTIVTSVLKPLVLAVLLTAAGLGSAQANVTVSTVPAVYSLAQEAPLAVQAHHRAGKRLSSRRGGRRFSRYYYAPSYRYGYRPGFRYRPYRYSYRPYGSRSRRYGYRY